MVLPHGAFFLSRSQNHIPITMPPMDEIHQMWLLAEFILEDGFPSKGGFPVLARSSSQLAASACI